MEKRLLIIGSGLVIVLMGIASIIFSGNNDAPDQFISELVESESTFSTLGFISSAEYVPRYSTLQLDVWYDESFCFDVISKVAANFGEHVTIIFDDKTARVELELGSELNLDVRATQLSLPIIRFEGPVNVYDNEGLLVSTEEVFSTVLSGTSLCSERVLTQLLCTYLQPRLSLCQETVRSEPNREQGPEADTLCYASCNVEYISNGIVVNQHVQGPPCPLLPEYVPQKSAAKARECYGDHSCKSLLEDRACCTQSQCVDNGACFDPLQIRDVDEDGRFEVCGNVNNQAAWVNADLNEDMCRNAGFSWLTCEEGECAGGIDKVDGSSNGLCCGNDEGESAITCEGLPCSNLDHEQDKLACCDENSCTFNGQCYNEGCAVLDLPDGGTMQAYCNGESWVDLDRNFCILCMGEDAWSGLVCCGDDPNEGTEVSRFIAHDERGTTTLPIDVCTNTPDSCILPDSVSAFDQGCFDFTSSEYLSGGYFCAQSEWYDLDNNSEFCSACGFDWTGVCCGDDTREHLIGGADGTSACCDFETDEVVGGVCFPTVACGNNKREVGEQCESPHTDNNAFCQQDRTACQGTLTGIRDDFGFCQDDCTCVEDDFSYSCVADSCGATCSNDADCPGTLVCDQTTCGCREPTFCGDFVLQEINDNDWQESCEFPDTIFNPYCNETIQCFGVQTGIRAQYGSCTSTCQCDYEPFQRICVRGSCGAECNQDGTGCGFGEICDLSSCGCIPSDIVCGDEVCDEGEQFACPRDCFGETCPFRIDIELDKATYEEEDTMHISVTLLDVDSKPIPDTQFDMDVVVNNNYINTVTYTTTSEGTFNLRRKVSATARAGGYEYIAYIAKSRLPYCNTIGDSANAFVFTQGSEPSPINLSRFEIVFGDIEQSSASICGNNEIERGEVCEGSQVCRPTFGCNYNTRTYDITEICNACSCPADVRSAPDDAIYCNNCEGHCGDGVLNCGEVCEEGMVDRGIACRDGQLYHQFDQCLSCNWQDDGIANDELVDDCFCDCGDAEPHCDDGNYIQMRQDYHAGCVGDSCNACACKDVYTKDTNSDGIEDKCSPELCHNGIDDNDNGLIDLDDPECSLCENCGIGTFNICDRQECGALLEGCFFNQFFLQAGTCKTCEAASCESYGSDQVTCEQDACTLSNCHWNGNSCCTDSDGDSICDSVDNCPTIQNTDQSDPDQDGVGSVCEQCPLEPRLITPTSAVEAVCDDGIDNDCDLARDCADPDCAGTGLCCQTALDCSSDRCTIESCVDFHCVAEQRSLCDAEECASGLYCSATGSCEDPDSAELVCLRCAQDSTPSDEGIGFGTELFAAEVTTLSTGLCCGDDPQEYFLKNGLQQAACCDQATDCVDAEGACVNSNMPGTEGHSLHCSRQEWYACSRLSHTLCAEAGSTYVINQTYRASQESGWFCTFDGISWGWRSDMPAEICSDEIDNDCDGMIDSEDTNCLILAE